MKANRIHRFGPPDVIVYEEVVRPEPGPDEVLVRVHAAGVGPWDAWIRAGKSVLPQPLPLTLGSDLCGVVEVVGADVHGFTPGDTVFGVTNARFTGAYAEYAVAASAMLAPKPHRPSDVEAAAVPVVAVTAWQMLFEHARVGPGTTVLVHGAGGSVGAHAVQLARLEGARVLATAGTDDLAYVRGLGADAVVDYRTARFEDVVGTVDVVVDTVGGDVQRRSFSVLKPGGALVSAVSQPDAAEAGRRGVRATFLLVDVTTAHLTRIAALLDAGSLTTRVGAVLSLAEGRTAHELLDGLRPRPRGKIVLRAGG
jgi:NADPH:quinone reductase-like Zn-dependent oxidoreductase